jgi:hypothetical protein
MEDTPESKRQALANEAIESAGQAKRKRRFPMAGIIWGALVILAFGVGHAMGACRMAHRTDGTVLVDGEKRNDGTVYQTFEGSPIVCYGGDCISFSPFGIVREDAVWQLPNGLYAWKRFFNPEYPLVSAWKFEGGERARVEFRDEALRFKDFDGRKVEAYLPFQPLFH